MVVKKICFIFVPSFSYEKNKAHIVHIALSEYFGTGRPLCSVWVFFMENKVKLFEFNSKQVRLILNEKEELFFCAKDVTDILGYKNGRDAVLRHCKSWGVVKYDIPQNNVIQQYTFIDEGNLYRLILKSELPDAEPFETWVCEEVLPSIRKTGKYEIKKISNLPDFTDPVIAARAWADEYEAKILEREAKQLAETKVVELTPKAEAHDLLMTSDNCVNMAEAAKLLKLPYGRNILFGKLREEGIVNDKNVAYQQYIDEGYFETKEAAKIINKKTMAIIVTVVTQKGLTWLAKRLAKINTHRQLDFLNN